MTVKRSACFVILLSFFLGFFSQDAHATEVLEWKDCVREAAKNHHDLIAAVEGFNQSKA